MSAPQQKFEWKWTCPGKTMLRSLTHQENDTSSDLSDLSCPRHVRRNQTDLMDLTKAMYLSVQDVDAWSKTVEPLQTASSAVLHQT